MVCDAAGGRAAQAGALMWCSWQHCVNVSMGGCVGVSLRKSKNVRIIV